MLHPPQQSHQDKKVCFESCHNTFEVINGPKQFCSIEYRKKRAFEPSDRLNVASIKKAYNYDYFVMFPTNIKDWISSPNPSRYPKKKRSSLKEKDEKVFSENENISISEEVSKAG